MKIRINIDGVRTLSGKRKEGDVIDCPVGEAIKLIKSGEAEALDPYDRSDIPFRRQNAMMKPPMVS